MRLRVTFLFPVFRGRGRLYKGRIHDCAFFEYQTLLNQKLPHLREELFLYPVFFQQAPETPDSVPVRNLPRPVRSAERRKRPAVNRFVPCRHIRQRIQVLNHEQPEHEFQAVGLIAALSFIIVRLDDGFPFSPRNQTLHLFQKFLFVCAQLRQFISPYGDIHLIFHASHYSAGIASWQPFFVRCFPKRSSISE